MASARVSAAAVCGEGTVAVLLSGMMRDGAKGIAAVVKQGGTTIAQDEATSEFFDMPAAALSRGRADLTMNRYKSAPALYAKRC
jgi:two-component system chemotaxis response regulator CheB